MKRCADVYQHICDNLDQDLNSAECMEIRKHLEGCPDCRAYLDSLKQTVFLYRSIPFPHVPRRLHTRLIRAIPLFGTGGRTTRKKRTHSKQVRKKR
jgi:hypothetical protein